MTVAGLLLAAGAGTRLGQPKATLEWHGRPLAEHGAAVLAGGGCAPVIVVLGAVVVDVPGAVVVVATGWATGMAASLRAGLAALPAEVDAVVVALADQPLIPAEAVRRLVGRAGARAAVATYDGRRRNPVLLDRSVWAEVAATVTGDSGAKAWLDDQDDVVEVSCEDVGSPDDIDTPADLARLGTFDGR